MQVHLLSSPFQPLNLIASAVLISGVSNVFNRVVVSTNNNIVIVTTHPKFNHLQLIKRSDGKDHTFHNNN